jgi:hypothetical protein
MSLCVDLINVNAMETCVAFGTKRDRLKKEFACHVPVSEMVNLRRLPDATALTAMALTNQR